MRKSKSERQPIPKRPSDTTSTLAIKCYDEQCLNGSMDKTLKEACKLSTEKYLIYGIIHNKEGKPHLHLAIKVRKGSPTVSSILTDLGIRFRTIEDKQLMENRGLETLGSFAGYFVYLTHTDAISQKLKKQIYNITDFYTNLDRTQFLLKMEGKLPKIKMTIAELHKQHCLDAFNAGYELLKYKTWYENRAFIGIPKTKNIEMNKWYEKGFEKRKSELHKIERLQIAIKPDTSRKVTKKSIAIAAGKALRGYNITYAMKKEPEDLDEKVEALIIDKSLICNRNEYANFYQSLIDVGDRYTIWQGKFLIVVGWPESDIYDEAKFYENLEFKKKFYCCSVDDNYKLFCDPEKGVCKKGTFEEQLARKELYMEFRQKFNKALPGVIQELEMEESKPKPEEKRVDYCDIND